MMEKDRRARLWNQERLRGLERDQGAEVRLFAAHDVREFEALSGHPFNEPARRPVRIEHAPQPTI